MAVSSDPFAPVTVMLTERLAGLLAPATTFGELFADDAVMEFPYAPIGGTASVAGRAELVTYFYRVAAVLAIDRISNVTVHLTRESDVAIVEYRGDGRVLRSGRPYVQRYISVITARGGRIARWIDYWNPMAAADAFDGAA